MADGNVPQQAPRLDALQLLKQLEQSLLNVYTQAKKIASNLKQLLSGMSDWADEEGTEKLNGASEKYIEQTETLEKTAEKALQKIRTDIERFGQLTPAKQETLTKTYLEDTNKIEQASESLDETREHLHHVKTFFEERSIEASNDYRFNDGYALKKFTETAEETEVSLENLQKIQKESQKHRLPYLPLIKSGAFFDTSSTDPKSIEEFKQEEPNPSESESGQEEEPTEQEKITSALEELRAKRSTLDTPPSLPMSDEADLVQQSPRDFVSPEPSQIADALAALKKNRNPSPVIPAQKPTVEEKPPQTESAEPSSAAIASAIQNTLGPIPVGNTQQETATSTRKAPRAATSQEQKTISETRAELKEKYAVRQHETEILKLYSERMRTRSMEYLQTHDPVRYTQVQQTQVQVGTTTTIDATVFLQTSELQTVHLLALTDVRATFSDATDELMSQLLLAQATSQMALLGVAAQGTQILAGQAVAATLGAATMGALAATGIAASGLASVILTKADQTRQALQREEENLAARASQLRAASSSTMTANVSGRTGPANLDTLRDQQQTGATARRSLQAGLHSQLQGAQMANQLSNALGKRGPGAPTTVQQQAMVGVLYLLEGQAGLPRRPSSSGSTQPSSRGNTGTSQSVGKTTDGGSRDQGAVSSDASRAAHEASLASKLQAGKLRDRRMAEIEQTEVGSSGIGSRGSLSGGGQGFFGDSSDQILQTQGSRRPISQKEVFAQKQRAMSSRSQSFLGVGAVAGGFEAAFNEPSVDDRGNVIEVGDDELLPLEDEEAQRAAMEEQRVAEFQAEQQRARQSNDNTQKKQNALDTIEKGKKLLNNKTVAQSSKLLLNPAVLAAAVVILFFWLNLRLFFSNEESSWRKPLGGWGKIGTVAFDLALVLSFLITFLLMVSTVLMPLLPVLLAIGGVSATISNITH